MFKSALSVSILGVAFLLSGCQTQGVNLEQAKNITLEFSKGYQPPPRTTSDILSLLDEGTIRDRNNLEQSRKIVQTSPPADLDDEDLYYFLLKRGNEASYIGDFAKAEKDYTRALEIARKLDRNDANSQGISAKRPLTSLSIDQIRLGHYETALKHARERFKYITSNQSGQMLSGSSLIAWSAAEKGDIEEAQKFINTAKSYVSKTYQWRDGNWGLLARAYVVVVDARLKLQEGRYNEIAELSDSMISQLESDRDDDYNHSDRTATYAATPASIREENLIDLYNIRTQAFLRLAEYERAELEARKSLQSALSFFGRYSYLTNESLAHFSGVLVEQARYDEALQLANEVLENLKKMGGAEKSTAALSAQQAMAKALVGKHDFSKADALYDKLFEVTATNNVSVRKLLLEDIGWIISGISSDQAAKTLLRLSELDLTTSPIDQQLAHAFALSKTDQQVDAVKAYQTAVPGLLAAGLSKNTKSLTIQFRKLALEEYLSLLHSSPVIAQMGIDALSESFVVADYARNTSVLHSLAAQAARSTVLDNDVKDLIRREQDAQHQIKAAQRILNGISAGSERATKLHHQIDLLSQSRRTLLEEIKASAPDYQKLKSPQPASPATVAAMLKPAEQLISIYTAADKTYVWALTKNEKTVWHVVETPRTTINASVDRIKTSLTPIIESLNDIPAFPVADAHNLYQLLIKPVLTDKKELLVIAHGHLSHIPFGLLATKNIAVNADALPLFSDYQNVPWLAKDVSITNLPATTAIVTLRTRPSSEETSDKTTKLIAFADPIFSPTDMAPIQLPPSGQRNAIQNRGLPATFRNRPQTRAIDSADLSMLPRLPDTVEEVVSISNAIGSPQTSDLIMGLEANEQKVKEMDLTAADILIFATHGLIPGDLNGLMQPALAMANPLLSKTTGDGLLTMDEILSLKLDAKLVLLSACNTAAGEGAEAEAVSGLGQAFFYAGSQSLLVSYWPVHSVSAMELTTAMFSEISQNTTTSSATALQKSALKLLKANYEDEQGQPLFSYAHPIFWAPFNIVGDGGL